MTTHPTHTTDNQPVFRSASLVGLLFFLFGAPHIYIFFKHRAEAPPGSMLRYAWVALLALAIAAVMELSTVT
ncbi:MAG: hypothetical protein ACTS2F_14640 [Thainema sp.]